MKNCSFGITFVGLRRENKTSVNKNAILYTMPFAKFVDGLVFEVPPLASDVLLTTLHPLLENVLQIVDHVEISYLGAPFHGWKSPEIARGEIWTVWWMSTFFKPNTEFNSYLAPRDF
jgi:hypothetical protein